MTKNCFIVEDLLPLYNEGLLSIETEDWVNEHLKSCSQCRELEKIAAEPITEKAFISPINHEKMMSKITLKLSLYQMIFIGISFFLALQTTLLNDSFGFILSYTVLGFVTYLFYKNFIIVIVIAFLPVFFWSIGTTFLIKQTDVVYEATSILFQLSQAVLGSLLIASIHLVFAIIGTLIGYLILKIKESGEKK